MTLHTFYLLIISNSLLFAIGFIIGKLSSNSNTLTNINDMVTVKSKKETRNTIDLEIDDTKYVSKISTDGLEKKYDSLGKVNKTKNDTASSVNKLKNLKR